MTPAALAAECRLLLGPVAGPVEVSGPGTRGLAAALATAGSTASGSVGGAVTAVVVGFVGTAARPGERQALLAGLRQRLDAGAPLLLVDHNQPRSLGLRILGALALLARGLPPSRARYPAARELQALGFVVERLRLADHERVQLVLARRE